MELKQYINNDFRFSGIVPESWVQAQSGVWFRHASENDQTFLVQQRAGGLSIDDILELAVNQESLDEFPEHVGRIECPNIIWDWYRGKASTPTPKAVDIALAQHENWIYIVLLKTTPDEIDDLQEAVFQPVIQTLTPLAPDFEYMQQIEAHAEAFRKMNPGKQAFD